MNSNAKGIIDRWNSINIVIRIICGLAIGTILALIVPGLPYIPLLGTVFVGALKAVAPILVFFLIIGALCNKSGNTGKQFKTVIILYIAGTIIASAIAVIVSTVCPVTVTLIGAAEAGEVTSDFETLVATLLGNLVSNPVSSIVNGNYLGILFWAIMFGLIIRTVCADSTKQMFCDLSDVVTKAVRIVISFAPFGVLGLIYSAISDNGIEIFAEYGMLLALLVGSMMIVTVITNPALFAITTKRNPFPLAWQCIRESAITAFFTRSSAANIPVNMALCEKLHLNKEFYSVSIPLGATINMSGAAITIAVMTLAAVHTIGIEVPLPIMILLCVASALGACGASGVAGGSLLLIPLACSLFGIGQDIAMQMVAIGFIIGVIQDSFETALNSATDVYFTAAADMRAADQEGRVIEGQ